MSKDYTQLAVEARARELASSDESNIEARANALRDDERMTRHCALCREHGLPDHTAPDELVRVMQKREDEFWSGFYAQGNCDPAFRALAQKVGLDPATAERRDVWTAMRALNHPLVRAVRDPATGAFRPRAAA